ncbi:hypothetical protein BDR07DRAFT_1422858 [Suillus spraguei]|nr:hypothetical protein BDR07DRAFT_1422858 [Suillus spraguei]
MSSSRVWFIMGSSSGIHVGVCPQARGHCGSDSPRKPEVLPDLAARHPADKLVLKVDVL